MPFKLNSAITIVYARDKFVSLQYVNKIVSVWEAFPNNLDVLLYFVIQLHEAETLLRSW